MLPQTLIGCSAKSYFTLDTGRAWAEQLARELRDRQIPGEGVYICPAFPLVPIFRDLLAGTGVAVGTQDVSMYPPGPYTGEVSAQLLAELGVRYVMVGHPERRRLFGEGPADVRRKVAVTVTAGMVPVLVVGEPERMDDPMGVLGEQLAAAFDGVPPGADVVVAYEPTWAIGQPEPAPGAHVVATVAALRDLLTPSALNARIVYGGSAKPGTYSDIDAAVGSRVAGRPDGVFLGRGGLDVGDFVRTIEEVRAAGPSSKVV